MYWLEVYNGLYSSMSDDNNFLNNEVIANDVRCDAYLKHGIKFQQKNRDRQNNNDNLRKPKKNKKSVMISNLSVCRRTK